MRVFAIDPGNEESAYVVYDSEMREVVYHSKRHNLDVLCAVAETGAADTMELVIEQVACMGMSVGAEVFETVFWSGRFAEAWGKNFHRVKRHQVKMHLCGNMRAKDPNIRQSIIDRYGGKDAAIGKKKTPGPLYGIAGDEWSALAVAITFAETVLPSSGATATHGGAPGMERQTLTGKESKNALFSQKTE